ncbi:MAG: c-type cytochrome biogenesis protein CcmI [Alphaproteobacteria bacterium]|nr:c-type cytochrome biogenesis protein CcmI [Alphaproteobacteria bacterium]
MLWVIVGVMTVLVLLFVLRPLVGGSRNEAERAEFDLAIYRDQLAEIETERRRGALSDQEAASAALEVERRMLRVDQERKRRAAESGGDAWRMSGAVALAVLVPAAGMLVYLRLGQPELPAQPLAARHAAEAHQAAEADRAQGGQIADLVGRLEARLEREPGDVQGWALLGRSYLMLERPADAVGAFARAASLDPNDPDIAMGHAESQVFAARGMVTPKADEEFRRTLKLDPRHPGARYYLALARAQAGDMQGAYDGWLDLRRDTAPDAPWKAALEARLAEAAKALNIDLAAAAPGTPEGPRPTGDAQPRGPTAEDMRAAAQMSEEDRAQMIRGMVEGLASRLKDNPADYDGWMRLGRAYQVLKETDKAREAYQGALAQRPGDRAAGQALAMLGGATQPAPAAAPAAPAPQASAGGENEMIRGMVERLAARLKEQPDDFEGWSRLGQSYAVLGRWQDAERAYGRAAELRPDDATALVNHGAAIMESEGAGNSMPERAEALFRQALAISPNHLDALWYVGAAEMQAGRPRVALVHWEKLRARLDPKSPEHADVERGIAAARQRLGR